MEAGGEKRAADAPPEAAAAKPSKKGKVGNRGNQGTLEVSREHTAAGCASERVIVDASQCHWCYGAPMTRSRAREAGPGVDVPE